MRVKRLVPRLMVVFFVLMTVLIVWTLLLDNPISDRYFDRLWIGIFPLVALAGDARSPGGRSSASATWPPSSASATSIALLLAHRGRRALPRPAAVVDRRRLRPHREQRGVGRTDAAGDDRHRRASASRSCCSTRPASTTSSGAGSSSTTRATDGRRGRSVRSRLAGRSTRPCSPATGGWPPGSPSRSRPSPSALLATVAWLLVARHGDRRRVPRRARPGRRCGALLGVMVALLVGAGAGRLDRRGAGRPSQRAPARPAAGRAGRPPGGGGPAGLAHERVGESWRRPSAPGVDELDDYVDPVRPRRGRWRSIGPVVVFVVDRRARPVDDADPAVHRARCWCCCWPSSAAAPRRSPGVASSELGWLSAFYLDMIRGLAHAQGVPPLRGRRRDDRARSAGASGTPRWRCCGPPSRRRW